MNKFLEFLQKKRYAIIWTGCYVVAMWAILQFMFNFNMFSAAQWNVLMHAQLRGFAGFVFGLLILAAVPLYVATTAIIIRTGKPLIPVKIPKFMTPVPIQEDNKKEDVPQTTPQVEETDKKIVPTELKAAFERARVHVGAAPKSVFDIGNVITNRPQANETQSVPELQPSDALPLPNDFDVSVDEVPSFTPVFSDMDFEVAGAAVMHMLNLAEPPDAFFCISDMLASAAIHAAIRRGCRVPEDISVVGFDNISISEMMNPSITTIKQPVAQLGALAAEMVIRMIEDKDEPLRSTYLGTELIIRESTRK